MSDIITTLHPENDENINLYPNVKKENIPNGSIDTTKLGNDVISLLNSINQLKPSGVDTSANILAFTSNKGIYIGSDTGNWYYWNGTQYVSGGTYIADPMYDELNEDLQNLAKTKSFSVNANTNHSSTLDYIEFNIESGKDYYVYVETSNEASINMYAFNDSTSQQITPLPQKNTFILFTANSNYTKVGIYVGNSTLSTVCNVRFSVLKSNNIINEYIKSKDTLNIYGNSFKMNPTSVHSSLYNQLNVNFKSGSTIYLYTYSDDNVAHDNVSIQYYLVKNDTTYIQINSYVNKLIKYDTSDDIVKIALWVSGNSGISDNLHIVAFNEISLINKLIATNNYNNIYFNSFKMDGVNVHSSLYDRMKCDFKSGSKIYLYTYSDDNVNHNNVSMEYYFIKNDSTYVNLGAKFNTLVEYETSDDIVGISVWISGNSTINANVTFMAFSFTSLLGKIINDDNPFIPYSLDNNVDTQLGDYYSILKTDSDDVFQFLFVTDPHTLSSNNNIRKAYRDLISTLRNAFIKTSCEFLISGGDWLTSGDTQDVACKKLSILNGLLRDNFNNKYLPILGNHDTNYQGSGENPTLSNSVLKNILFNEYNSNYYTLVKNNVRLFVFDSGIDWETSMTLYRWEQINWFGNQLLENDKEHIILFTHIFSNQNATDFNDNPTAQLLAENITLMADAFNNKTTITLNSITYDFTNCVGTISFMMCGHSHFDADTVYNNIPIVITTNAKPLPPYDFDICYADFDNLKLQITRIGNGSNREIDIL